MASTLLVLVLVAQAFPWPLDPALLAVEDARRDPAPLVEALESREPRLRLQAIRAIGRFEREELAPSLLPFLSSAEPEERIAAALALAQMRATVSFASFLARERDPAVRGALYESLGRSADASEALLLPGLQEDGTPRFGAIKGLETYYRTNERRPTESALVEMRRIVRDSEAPAVRELALLALNRAGDADRETLEAAFRDPHPGVRRLAVAGLGEWRDDPSYLVRYEGLRAAGDCSHAESALRDPSEHVVLLAIDLLAKDCSPEPLEKVLRDSEGWRRPAHALVSLANVAPERARRHLARFVEHPTWQARVYAARAAKILGNVGALEKLRGDNNPNVVAEALREPREALATLGSDHYGLLVAALERLEGYGDDPSTVPTLLATLSRVTEERKSTSRDPRRLLLERLSELSGPELDSKLDYLLTDFDPFIASRAASVIEKATGRTVAARPRERPAAPLPPAELISRLRGARATFRMKEAGNFTVELLPEAAPVTAARFTELAESGYYDGLTFHRIVPNFVIQGGSPGANEYVGTAGYLRDEVSSLSHERGTLGISTRGRDTGDSQIFVNLVDNYRLDHDYTVFARVVDGMERVDRIQEDDVIESIEIVRER